ncbi:hypothetical protein K469DRAFT_673262 [Zopfia rhizophila CBS 207.26]|uniref:Nucleoporin Nup54 alpha-helical domain-containing protein n=1 Tax=Zopfia rhizophila CBS 207.26 TaxID=1314779 RepID=A0A6A6DNT0_9PEZI|nr:hypothetical protein K469DRAFT_673262 [Zopfia rhizophila CBS 207.26]
MTGFGRSNSLSINTSGSLFGNNASQGQQSAGLFGSSTNASAQPQTTGGLFGSTSQSQTGGLFGGAPAPVASQPPQSGTSSLFGGQHASQPASGGLFGNLNKPAITGTGSNLFGASTAQSQPQSGGLFGGALGGNNQNQNQNQNQTQNQTTSQSGGLFGQQQKPSLFGSSTQQTTSAPSLFGNTNAAQNQTSTPSLFGSTQQTQPQRQNSLFGGMSSTNKPFGGLTLGGHTVTGGPMLSTTQQPVQMQSLDAIKGTTRFSDLSPDLQSSIQQIDGAIQNHINASIKVRESMPEHGKRVDSISPDVKYIEQFVSTVELGIDNDSSNIAHLKQVVKSDAEEAMLSFRAVENLKLPSQFHYTNLNSTLPTKQSPIPSSDDDDSNKPVDLVSYFSKRTDDLGKTLEQYQKQMREIEQHLRTMEAGTLLKAEELVGSRNGVRDQRRELVDALKAMENAILAAAKKVGETRDLVTKETMGSVGGGLV